MSKREREREKITGEWVAVPAHVYMGRDDDTHTDRDTHRDSDTHRDRGRVWRQRKIYR